MERVSARGKTGNIRHAIVPKMAAAVKSILLHCRKGTMFRAAVSNDIIAKHPMDGVRYTKPVRAVSDIHFLTVEEQNKFLEAAKRSHNYRQYALLLETGLRTSEMIGLTWDSIKLEETYPDCQQNFGIQASDSCMEGGTTQDGSQLPYDSAD